MKKIGLFLSVVVFSITVYSQPREQLKIGVHPGVELFTIVQYLAGKYPPSNPSIYSKEVDAWFSKYKNHPAVQKVASFDKVYPDLTELGWCMSGFPPYKFLSRQN